MYVKGTALLSYSAFKLFRPCWEVAETTVLLHLSILQCALKWRHSSYFSYRSSCDGEWGRVLLFSKLVYSDVAYSNTILLFVCFCVTHTNERIVLGLSYLRDC